MDDWYDRAGVRRQPRRRFAADESSSALFSRRSLPEFGHPLVQGLDPAQHERILAQHLYRYLRFTVHLETRVVNRALTALATQDVAMPLTDQTREEALLILTDESFHAQASLNMLRQVAHASRIDPVRYDFDAVLELLDGPEGNHASGYEAIRHLLQACVFETMVTSILDELPADDTVHPSIRRIVADHAEDERVHHVYFARFFPELWTALDGRTRSAVARDLPQMILACAQPDVRSAEVALIDGGLRSDVAREVIQATYSRDVVTRRVRTTARHTIRLLTRCGVLDSDEGRDSFTAAGLIAPDATVVDVIESPVHPSSTLLGKDDS
ncbi:diiron oxygenase [Micromonospora sp. DT4]|uniref:diiron oxygenase n=1 Tax=Micromonospora sp. DT4 TaxID=3393438 RepID=UPI003CE896FD